MSLYFEAMEESQIMDKVSLPDGRGGTITKYKPGAKIMVAYSFDTSTQARIAEADGVNNRFTLSTRKNVNLQYHDVVKRLRDGKIFRVTSDGDDNRTPASAALDKRDVEAEEWEIPASEIQNG